MGFVPSLAKSVEHEPRNGISLCDSHHSDFNAYAFFIRWVPSVSLNSKVIGIFLLSIAPCLCIHKLLPGKNPGEISWENSSA
jgi:hypothetical protein